MKKKALFKLLPLILAVMTALSFTGCGSTSGTSSDNTSGTGSTGLTKVKLGLSAYPSWYLWFIAREEGYFQKNGLDVELVWFPTYSDSVQAFVTGKLDYVSLALSDTIAPFVKGQQHKIVLVNDYSCGADGLVAAPDIKTVKDLKGRTVATEFGTIEHFFLLRLLEENGMTEKDIKFTNMTIGDSGFAFLGGSVDAASLWEPALSSAQAREGTNTLYTSRQTPGLIPSVLVANENYIKTGGGNITKLLNAWFDAIDFYRENPDKALEYMAKGAEISVDEMKVTMSGSMLYSLQDNIDTMTVKKDSFDYIPYTTKITADFLAKAKLLDKTVEDYTGLFDVSYLNEVIKTRESRPVPDTGARPEPAAK